jgi:hypothetical protein
MGGRECGIYGSWEGDYGSIVREVPEPLSLVFLSRGSGCPLRGPLSFSALETQRHLFISDAGHIHVTSYGGRGDSIPLI